MLHYRAVVGPFQCNCHLLVCPNTGHGVLIDPGDDVEKIFELFQKAKNDLAQRKGQAVSFQLRAVFQTHGHLDHIGATREVVENLEKEKQGVQPKIFLHRGDEDLYLSLKKQGELFGFTHYRDPLQINNYFEHEQKLKVGEMKFSVIHTPGHSPGSICVQLHEDSSLGVQETLYSGDTLFQGSIGRTDLWGGDTNLLLKSIRDRLFSLDGDIPVLPGHGDATEIGIEKKTNPFLR